MSEAYELFGCNNADLYIIGIATGDNNAACQAYYETHNIPFSALSGIEGGGNAINSTYGISAYPTYILIAPDHDIVEQDMWPIANTQTFIDFFEGNGLMQSDCSALSADFLADATDICEMDVVNFTDMSSGDITSWSWTFEGGDPAASTEQNPMVTYNDQGEYDVELTVSDGSNSNTILLENYISVSMTPPALLQPFDDVCIGWPAFELTGGSPAGGVYSGPGVENGMFDPDVAGLGTHTIIYTYTASNGCDNFDEETILVDPCTGINEIDAGMVSLYPNPSKGVFELKLNHNGAIVIQVVNIVGVTIYSEQTTVSGKTLMPINLQEFEDGIYFVTIKTDENTTVKKLRLVN